MADEKKLKLRSIEKIRNSIDNLLVEGKEQKLKAKLSKKIKDSIFTEEVLMKLNECDFTGIADEEDNVVKLFESIFPIFIKDGNSIFRLYKHKVEVDLSDEMKDRYIYMFSDGRLTSGLFQCFSLSDDEYVYGIKKIVDVVPKIRKELLDTITDFKSNMKTSKAEMADMKDREKSARENYNKLEEYISEKDN